VCQSTTQPARAPPRPRSSGLGRPRSETVRVALLVGLEVVVLLALLVVAATVAIPLAAPPPSLPTPTLPLGALRDCPVAVRGCG
jgi:hypothetical protein